MLNLRLVRFWIEIDKLRKSFENDGFVLGFYVIDPENGVAEIDGDKNLKKLLFDVSPHINAKWSRESERSSLTPQHVRPENTSCWLPFLPPGGISAMTEKTLKLYWSPVMRAVLPERKSNMGYDTHR